MQEEWYHPDERSERLFKAALSTPEGRERIARFLYEAHRVLEWRIKHQGVILSPEEMATYEAILAKHGHIYESDQEQ